MTQGSSSSGKACLWIAVGCGLMIFLGVGLIVTLGWLGVREVKKFEETMKDPEQRARKVHEVLGVEELPPGYRPAFAMSVPFVMDLAVISEAEGVEWNEDLDDSLGESGFFFARLRAMGRNSNFTFREGSIAIDEAGVDIQSRGLIERGELEIRGDTIEWEAHRGQFGHQNESSLITVAKAQCEKRKVLGIWFEPDPDPSTPIEELDLEGTPGDPLAVESFLGYFDFCPG